MADTAIEWADRVWNPTTGCDRVSPGCDNCYALTMAKRLKGMGSAKYQRDGDPKTSGPGFGLSVHPDTLELPLKWRKPQRIFVNSMSDLFHDQVPDEFIAQVFAVMCHAHQHTFQVLTKRHARMRSLLSSDTFRELVFTSSNLDPTDPNGDSDVLGDYWPLPNVWLGVSAENQQWANIRIPVLLGTPAAVRFVSAEPLLGPIDLTKAIEPNFARGGWKDLSRLHWAIVGGESGHSARPMHPDWARGLRDQCQDAGVAFLFKQQGEYQWLGMPDDDGADLYVECETGRTATDEDMWHISTGHWWGVRRVGKHKAGRKLDGRTWDQYPTNAQEARY